MMRRAKVSVASRLPAVGALVLIGNIVRNTALVAAQASGLALAGWAHEMAGLIVLAAVCRAIAGVVSCPAKDSHA